MKLPKKIRIPKFKKRTMVTMVVLSLLILFSTLPPVNALFISLFIIFISFRIDTKILGGVSIALLVSIPILQHFEKVEEAEQMAVYVYFLLVIIVLVHIIESRRVGAGEWIGESQDESRSDLSKLKVKSEKLKENTDTIHIDERRETHPMKSKSTFNSELLTFNSSSSFPRRRSSIPTGVEKDTTHVDWSQVDTEDVQSTNQKLRARAHAYGHQASTREHPIFVEPVWKRDERKENYIPDHRLATDEDYREDTEDIPLHLSLPERLKLLSEKQKAELSSAKPSLDGVKRVKS